MASRPTWGAEAADTFHKDLHPDLKADFILANPPFNMSDWGGDRLRDDVRWRLGAPPVGNANFGWIQHMIHHLSPTGMLGLVLANGSMSSSTSGEGEIRKKIVEADLVDCMVALPGQLFYGTPIPTCLWFIARDKSGSATKGGRPLRDRRGETLFIDARSLGSKVTRIQSELSDEEIQHIAGTYHAWRGDGSEAYKQVDGFCANASLEIIAENGFVLNPGRYVGSESLDDEEEGSIEERVGSLVRELRRLNEEGQKADQRVEASLRLLTTDE